MQVAYLDEAETSAAYYITALCMDSSTVHPLEVALQSVVEWAADTFGGVSDDAELHAVDLVGGQRDWQRYRPTARIPQRIAVYDKAIEAIAGLDVRIYIRGADKATHASRYLAGTDIHGTVLPWTLERVQGDAKSHDDLAMVIADERALANRYRRDMGNYRRYGTWGWRAQHLDRIVDTLHFAPSKFSRCLQAADLASYCHVMQHKKHRHPNATVAWQRAWNLLLSSGRIYEATCWPA